MSEIGLTEKRRFCVAGGHASLHRIGEALTRGGASYGHDRIDGDDDRILRHIRASLPRVIIVASWGTLRRIDCEKSHFPDLKVVYSLCEGAGLEEISHVIDSEIDGVLFAPMPEESVRAILMEVFENRHPLKQTMHRLLRRYHAGHISKAREVGAAKERGNRTETAMDRPALSPRQREIMELICDGNSTKIIAEKLNLSELTVSDALKSIRTRLNASNIAHAAARYTELKNTWA
jgi:DNA-binding NarL/FixJ family response regulator